jgi:hypothetical protein
MVADGARSPVSRLHEEDKGFCFLRFIGPVHHLANNDLKRTRRTVVAAVGTQANFNQFSQEKRYSLSRKSSGPRLAALVLYMRLSILNLHKVSCAQAVTFTSIILVLKFRTATKCGTCPESAPKFESLRDISSGRSLLGSAN